MMLFINGGAVVAPSNLFPQMSLAYTGFHTLDLQEFLAIQEEKRFPDHFFLEHPQESAIAEAAMKACRTLPTSRGK